MMRMNTQQMEHACKAKHTQTHTPSYSNTWQSEAEGGGGCDSRVRLGGVGSYLEVRLDQWQQENGLGHGWVAGLEDGQQEGSLGLRDIRETVPCQ